MPAWLWHEFCAPERMRIALSLLCSAAVLARSASLLACGASDEPYYAVGEQLPIGEGVPLNAPLVVELAERANGPESHLNPRLSLAVKGTDEALELAPLGSAPHLVWVPLQPLAPSTAYEARFNTGYEGAPDHTWQFTTGDALTSTVAIDGELQVTFEAGADPIKECGNNCGTDCKEVGKRAVTKARVRLPRASLGFPKLPRDGVADGPHTLRLLDRSARLGLRQRQTPRQPRDLGNLRRARRAHGGGALHGSGRGGTVSSLYQRPGG